MNTAIKILSERLAAYQALARWIDMAGDVLGRPGNRLSTNERRPGRSLQTGSGPGESPSAATERNFTSMMTATLPLDQVAVRSRPSAGPDRRAGRTVRRVRRYGTP